MALQKTLKGDTTVTGGEITDAYIRCDEVIYNSKTDLFRVLFRAYVNRDLAKQANGEAMPASAELSPRKTAIAHVYERAVKLKWGELQPFFSRGNTLRETLLTAAYNWAKEKIDALSGAIDILEE